MIVLDHAVKQFSDFTLDISLNVPPNTITALVGVNGSGKTTTFRAILGLLQLDSGTSKVFGHESWTMPKDIREKMTAIFSDNGFQESINLDNIIAIMHAFYPHFDHAQALKLSTSFQLPLKRRIGTFSTGMLAKAKTILAVCTNCNLLVLDEPTAGLDVIARNSILDLLREYMQLDGRSILISSHNSQDIEHLCDDFYFIDNGKVLLHDNIESLHNNYAVLNLTPAQMDTLDRTYVLSSVRVPGGFQVLTNQRQYYVENMPELEIGRGTIDELITVMKQGN